MSAAAPGPRASRDTEEGARQPDDGSVAKLIEIAEKPMLGQRLVSWSSRPPGRLYLPACAAVALILLFEDSMPGGHLPTYLFGLGAGAFLAGMGALRLGIALAVARPMIRRYWLRWITAPLIAAAALALAVTDVPLQARVEMSSPQLLELRDTTNRSTTIPLNGERVGLYRLSDVSVSGGITHYTVQGAGLLRQSGLAYSTQELPENVFVEGQGSRTYEHISENWYVWVRH